MINIAIIIKDTLKSAGLKSIFQEHFGIDPKCNITTPGNCNEVYDLIFTDFETMFENLDFFIPRRKICIFLSNSHSDNNIIINTEDDIEIIINKIEKILNKIKHSDLSSKEELSSREIDVLKLLAKGHTNKEMADKLNISINTILSHRKNITSKLGIRSVSGLTFYAMMHGYINNL